MGRSAWESGVGFATCSASSRSVRVISARIAVSQMVPSRRSRRGRSVRADTRQLRRRPGRSRARWRAWRARLGHAPGRSPPSPSRPACRDSGAPHAPVEQVLERPWEGPRVLGGAEQDRVRCGDRVAQCCDGCGQGVVVMIGVEVRQYRAVGKCLDGDSRWCAPLCGAAERGVRRGGPGASGDDEDPGSQEISLRCWAWLAGAAAYGRTSITFPIPQCVSDLRRDSPAVCDMAREADRRGLVPTAR